MWTMSGMGGHRSEGIRWRDRHVSQPYEKLDPKQILEALKQTSVEARSAKFLSYMGSRSESILHIVFLDLARWNTNEAANLLKELGAGNRGLAEKCLLFIAETGWGEIFAKLIAQVFESAAIDDLLIKTIQGRYAWRALEERQGIYLSYVARIRKHLPDSAADLELFACVAAQERHLLKEQPPAFLSSAKRYGKGTKAMLQLGRMLDALQHDANGKELVRLHK